MDAAICYIWQQSKWALTHADDPKWFMTIQRDVRDALRLAHVAAFGRPTLPSGELPAGFPGVMQPIEPEHWGECLPEIFDGMAGNKTANISRSPGSMRRAYYDIHFDRASTVRHWPRMSMLERYRHKPLQLK